jgi:hypothetical protein
MAKKKIIIKTNKTPSRWTRVLENMPVPNEQRRPTEQAVTGKESKN